jgi:hypothetical protein
MDCHLKGQSSRTIQTEFKAGWRRIRSAERVSPLPTGAKFVDGRLRKRHDGSTDPTDQDTHEMCVS